MFSSFESIFTLAPTSEASLQTAVTTKWTVKLEYASFAEINISETTRVLYCSVLPVYLIHQRYIYIAEKDPGGLLGALLFIAWFLHQAYY